ncbi:peptidylprolyl isomerase [Marinicella litoralis]|uniref:peptidylprolyl isomerase n=1 Tax=Marinicella litoralis TaxID=644220 RepID=A0A4R6XQJ7_9GAMM|nr:peptidylprolyl isomerase [Marinicella litoralis]TDR18538.1 parvulin-like peptidyl-prolyl cis-trans isomerase protein [Marinicella litoralis]
MNKFIVLVLMLVSAVFGWVVAKNFPLKSSPSLNSDVVAIVDGDVITKDEFIKQMTLRGGNRPGQYHDVKQRKFLLDFMINQKLMMNDAEAKGINKNDMVQKIYRKATIDKYLDEVLESKIDAVKVTEAEIKQHFDENYSVYEKPARKRAAVIYKATTSKTSAEEKAALKQSLLEVKAAVSDLDEDTYHFGDLALQHTDDRASKYQGGVIGWFIENPNRAYKWDRSVIQELFKLDNNGDVSDVVETDQGLFLVRLVASESVNAKTLDQVSSGIKKQLLKIKQDQVKKDFIYSLIDNSTVEINENLLAQIEPISPIKRNSDRKPPALPTGAGDQQ